MIYLKKEKFMKTGMLLLLALLISGSLVVNLHADHPSICKDEDDNATKEEKKDEKKKDEKEKPKTVEVEKKYIRLVLSLKGYFEDPDAIPVSIATKNWGELKVTAPPFKAGRSRKAISCSSSSWKRSSNALICSTPICP